MANEEKQGKTVKAIKAICVITWWLQERGTMLSGFSADSQRQERTGTCGCKAG